MSAIQKEQIYVELREYHLDELPETLSNSDMNDLLKEYRVIEDEIISMLLGLVNGKTEFADMTGPLQTFKSKVQPFIGGDKTEDKDREHLLSKITQLEHILNLAAKASFTIRPPRKTRESTRAVVTKVTRK